MAKQKKEPSGTTVYEVVVTPQVAQTRSDGTGSRRVWVGEGDDRILLEFTRAPTYLAEVPLEIEQDPHLLVKQVPEEDMAQVGGKLTSLLKAERIQENDAALAEAQISKQQAPPPSSPRPARQARVRKSSRHPRTSSGA
ncbi:MAG TPA: hypothetical protein VNJ70_17830 [Thermoanaerobaculia bacterium]|nr:hypothetical protein [Thermoanaerobaculia bacterium]